MEIRRYRDNLFKVLKEETLNQEHYIWQTNLLKKQRKENIPNTKFGTLHSKRKQTVI